MKKKKTLTFGGILLVLLALFFQFLLPEQEPQISQTSVEKSAVSSEIDEVDLSDPPRFEKIKVNTIRNVDGDTFAFMARGQEYKLRLLMVDTPESVKRGVAVQPFGKEASDFTKQQLTRGQVSLVFDKGEVQDQYQRFLAYVYVGDELLQDKLLENGLAVVRYVNDGGKTYVTELLAAQQKAQDEKRGVWSQSGYVKKTAKGYYMFEEQ
ncbi:MULTISPECIES: thermonuclease family protein [Enterococcus]|uniref:thermonuclease family protein n=1 Tax=Enterococcus TaxID=1350 RepID=UPI001F3A6C25|nr:MULTISPECIES: thermonuclease family protein [Enterococcus]